MASLPNHVGLTTVKAPTGISRAYGCGRRFASSSIMKWTGHSDYKAMRPYIEIVEKTKADAMKLIENAWGI